VEDHRQDRERRLFTGGIGCRWRGSWRAEDSGYGKGGRERRGEWMRRRFDSGPEDAELLERDGNRGPMGSKTMSSGVRATNRFAVSSSPAGIN